MEVAFPPLLPRRLSGDEPFLGGSLPGRTVLDFWRWGVSNLADNVTRGLLAEYLVAMTLELDTAVRSAWDAYDLVTASGLKVEVKSAAYLQAWGHKALSTIRFDIAAKRAWSAQTNVMENVSCRQADVYVFCLLKHQDKATLDPLNLAQWEFYVLRATLLNERCGSMRTLSLKALRALGAEAVPFDRLPGAVDGACR